MPGKPVRLLVVPAIDRPNPLLALDDFALPPDMITRVASFLDERRILGVNVEVGTPYYQGVTVAALVTARVGRQPTVVRERVLATLYRYLSPLEGGVDGEGWPFDTECLAYCDKISPLADAPGGIAPHQFPQISPCRVSAW